MGVLLKCGKTMVWYDSRGTLHANDNKMTHAPILKYCSVCPDRRVKKDQKFDVPCVQTDAIIDPDDGRTTA